jgi:hypothetical protein
MSAKLASPKSLAGVTGNYAGLLTDIKQRIRTAQLRTAMAGNASLLMLYWEIGSMLSERQKKDGWGAAVLPRLAADLHNELPEVKGFSARNLRRMIQFNQEYPGLFPIWPLPVAKSEAAAKEISIWPRPVAKLKTSPRPRKKRPPVVAQSAASPDDVSIWQRAVAQLPWAHNVILIGLILCEDIVGDSIKQNAS